MAKKKKRGSRRERKLMKMGLIKPKKVSLQQELEKPVEKVEVSKEREEFEKELEAEKKEEKKIEKQEAKLEKEGFKTITSQFRSILIAVTVTVLIIITLYILDVKFNWTGNIHYYLDKIAPPWDWDKIF